MSGEEKKSSKLSIIVVMLYTVWYECVSRRIVSDTYYSH